jgi:hypothetical protein
MSQATMLWVLAAGATGLPFAFGIIRAVTSGHDFRYIWVALASSMAGAGVMTYGKVSSPSWRSALTLAAGVFVVATTAAVLAARLLGTTIGPGMLVVASSFGLCFAFAAGLSSVGGRD